MTNKATDISVLICTCNRCGLLQNTLQGLLNQTVDGTFNYEIIVVDNNSTDKTRDVIEEIRPCFKVDLRYIFEKKQGKCYALNTGILEAKGNVIACADDDITIRNDWIQNIITIFRNRNIDLLGGKVELDYDHKMPRWVDRKMQYGPLGAYDLGESYIENDVKKILPIGANFSIKKSACLKYGNFLVKACRAEDTEFAERWHRLGAKIAYSPKVVVKHYVSSKRMTKSFFRKWYFLYGKNSRLIFADKLTSGRSFFGTSLWVYKELALIFIRFIQKKILFNKTAFSEETQILNYLGLIYSNIGWKTPFENLRV